jgi:hypothetical protein
VNPLLCNVSTKPAAVAAAATNSSIFRVYHFQCILEGYIAAPPTITVFF